MITRKMRLQLVFELAMIMDTIDTEFVDGNGRLDYYRIDESFGSLIAKLNQVAVKWIAQGFKWMDVHAYMTEQANELRWTFSTCITVFKLMKGAWL